MGSCAGRGREAEEAAAIARTTTLTAIAVNCSLKLAWRAEAFPLTLIRVQVFHVPLKEKHTDNTDTSTWQLLTFISFVMPLILQKKKN